MEVARREARLAVPVQPTPVPGVPRVTGKLAPEASIQGTDPQWPALARARKGETALSAARGAVAVARPPQVPDQALAEPKRAVPRKVAPAVRPVERPSPAGKQRAIRG